jgi:hypothetical protein
MMPDVRSDPAYADGYWANLHGHGFDLDRNYDEPYCEGWQAAERALSILTNFKRDTGGDDGTV